MPKLGSTHEVDPAFIARLNAEWEAATGGMTPERADAIARALLPGLRRAMAEDEAAEHDARGRRNLVSIAEAAAYQSVSVETVRRQIASGALTGYRLGTRTLRVDMAQVHALARPLPTFDDAA